MSVPKSPILGPRPRFMDAAPDVRREFDRNRDPLIAAQLDDLKKTEAERRESFMVKRSRPQPVLRPGPALSRGPDRAAFDAQWQVEREGASEKPRGLRRAEFIAKRQKQMRGRDRTRSR